MNDLSLPDQEEQIMDLFETATSAEPGAFLSIIKKINLKEPGP